MLPLTTKRPSVPFPPRGPTWGFDCLARRKWTHSCVHTDVGDGEHVAGGLGCEGREGDGCPLGTAAGEGRAPREGSRVVSSGVSCPQYPGVGRGVTSSAETICSQPHFTPTKTETRRREGASHADTSGGKRSVIFRSLSPTDHLPVHRADHTTSC